MPLDMKMPDTDIPPDLLAAAEETDAMIGDELAALIPPFEKPINVRVMDSLAKAIVAAGKVMGMEIVPDKYTEPVTELDPDLVRFIAMLGAAAEDYGKPLPSPDELRTEQDLTRLTAAIMELTKDPEFSEFLDMPADGGDEDVDVDINIEAPMPGGGAMEEDFDFASRMAPRR
jgi:hypothetical protein